MASNIVEYILDLKTKKAQTGLDNVSSKSKALTGSLKIMTGAIVGAGVAFGAASSAFLSFAQSQADIINNLNDLSTRSGVSAKSINALTLAFEASGQSASSVQGLLDKMPMIFSNLDRGGGNASKKFEELGLSLRDSNDEMKSTDQLLGDMITAIQGIENPTERAAAAVDLFGRQSANLMQALGNNSSLVTFSKITERFGVDVGPEASKQAAAFQQSIGVLSQVVQRFGQVFSKIFGVKGFVAPIQFGMEIIVELTSVIDNSITFLRAIIPRLGKEFDLAVAEIKKKVLDLKDEFLGFASFIIPIDVTQLEEDKIKAFKEIRELKREVEELPDLKKLFIDIDKKSRREVIDFRRMFNDFVEGIQSPIEIDIDPPKGDDLINEDQITEKWKTIELKKIAQIQLEIVDLTEEAEEIGSEIEAAMGTIIGETIAAGISGMADLLASGPERITKAVISGFGPIGEIISSSVSTLAGLGNDVISGLSSQIDRTLDLSVSSMEDIRSAQTEAIETLKALQRPDSKEAAAAERVAKVEQKIQAETLRKELAALRGAGGEDMQLAREIAMMEAEIQAVTFAKAIGQGLQMLPGMLLRILPSMLFDLARAIVEAIIHLPSRIGEALWQGFQSVVDAITLGLGDKFETAGENIKSTAQSIGEWFKNIGSGQAGLRFTGSQSGLALLHPKEVVVPESGRMSQAVGRSMADHAGGGGINISINSLVTERSAIDELVRQVERRFYTFGNSTSPLFN